jgi:hypothetical protein
MFQSAPLANQGGNVQHADRQSLLQYVSIRPLGELRRPAKLGASLPGPGSQFGMKRFRSAALLTCNSTGAPLRRGVDIVGEEPMLVGRCTATVTKAHTGVARRVARGQLDTWPKNGFQVSGSVGAVRIDFRRPLPSLVARWCQQHKSDVRVEPTRLVLDMTLMRVPPPALLVRTSTDRTYVGASTHTNPPSLRR